MYENRLALSVLLLALRPQIAMFAPELQSRLSELTPRLLSDWQNVQKRPQAIS
jgi:hypothetical protein